MKKWIGKEPGAVHGAVYRNAFGESVSEGNVVGEGFALRNGQYELEKFEINSGVFNNPKGSKYHDHRRRLVYGLFERHFATLLPKSSQAKNLPGTGKMGDLRLSIVKLYCRKEILNLQLNSN